MEKSRWVLFALAVALVGCGSSDCSSNNPLDGVKGQVDARNEMSKELKETGKARAKQADDIVNQRLKGGAK